MVNIDIANWSEYELLDSGNGRKLERFGKYVLDRIETQALWRKMRSSSEWEKADAVFKKIGEHGKWEFRNKIPDKWILPFDNLNLELRLTPFGHVGIFPEQANQWFWIKEKIKNANRPLNILSLFTYTGASSLAAVSATNNTRLVHVDASKPAITWARDNQRLSGLSEKPVRWIPEDALKFVKREVRRTSRYDAIIMDPPKFGRGPQGEVWKFEENFPELLDYCRQLLSEQPLFVLITAYAVPISSVTLANLLEDTTRKLKGNLESGELGLKQNSNDRILPTAIYAKWENS